MMINICMFLVDFSLMLLLLLCCLVLLGAAIGYIVLGYQKLKELINREGPK